MPFDLCHGRQGERGENAADAREGRRKGAPWSQSCPLCAREATDTFQDHSSRRVRACSWRSSSVEKRSSLALVPPEPARGRYAGHHRHASCLGTFTELYAIASSLVRGSSVLWEVNGTGLLARLSCSTFEGDSAVKHGQRTSSAAHQFLATLCRRSAATQGRCTSQGPAAQAAWTASPPGTSPGQGRQPTAAQLTPRSWNKMAPTPVSAPPPQQLPQKRAHPSQRAAPHPSQGQTPSHEMTHRSTAQPRRVAGARPWAHTSQTQRTTRRQMQLHGGRQSGPLCGPAAAQ